MTSPLDRPDPFKLYPYGSFGVGMASASGRVQVDPRLVPGQKTGVIVTLGQSNISNSVGGTYQSHTPASTMVHNLNIIDGGVYQAKDALLGCHGTGSNTASRLGTALIQNNKYARVILAPIGFSASTSGNWAAGGDLNHRIGVLARRLAVHSYMPNFIIWHQGEADAAAGTPRATTAANIQSMIATFRGFGINCPVLVCLASYTSAASPSNANTRGAQTDVLNAGANIFQGADTDTLGSSNRNSDDLHFNATGSAAFSTMLYNIMVPMIPA